MKTYQFIIIIVILVIFLLFFVFGMLSIYLTYVEKRYCPPCIKNEELRTESKKSDKVLEKKGKKKGKRGEDLLEGFEGLSDDMIDKSIYENTMPNLREEKPVDVSKFWTGVELKYGKPLPGDNKKMGELEKIYNNPFYEGDDSKGTAGGREPKRNYPRPGDMVIVERDAYKFGYPDGMSMQDYVDWVYLFRKTPNLLNLEHYINYEKLIAGVPIVYKEGKTPPPA